MSSEIKPGRYYIERTDDWCEVTYQSNSDGERFSARSVGGYGSGGFAHQVSEPATHQGLRRIIGAAASASVDADDLVPMGQMFGITFHGVKRT